MFNEIALEPAQVPAQLRGSYTGRKFKVRVGDKVTIPSDAGLWDHGSRDVYNMLRIVDGAAVPFPGQQAAPWDSRRADQSISLTPGYCVVRHSSFQGKDMGLCFYLHPADAAPMLPAPAADLDPVAQLVVNYTVSRKSSYMGRDRYQMALEDNRWARPPMEPFPTRGQWDAAKAEMIARGYLNKAGAITPAGRNVAKSI